MGAIMCDIMIDAGTGGVHIFLFGQTLIKFLLQQKAMVEPANFRPTRGEVNVVTTLKAPQKLGGLSMSAAEHHVRDDCVA